MTSKGLITTKFKYMKKLIEKIKAKLSRKPLLVIPDVSKYEGNSVKATVCPECGCNKLQHDYVKHYTCLNVLCDWQGQTGC